MQCPRCQHENPADATFCDECGARLEALCPACGETNRAGAKFCRKCGQSLVDVGARGQTATSKFASPDSYTPRHLAERILNSKAALEGERKQVTVLFADLKGSMELLADRDPEDARKLLDPVLERMMEAVHRYEGTVNQVMGDGIMALFGAPLAHEDHAVRACYAALRMQETVKKYAEAARRSNAAVVKIRVGLNSGEVVVRAIGSDLHMDYTAVGQTTHLAARMEQIADPGAIVITPETLALAEGYVEVKPLGPMSVKGLADAVEVYEVTGAGPARTRLQASARHGLTRFVGRDAELEQLRRAQQLAGDGHGQVAAIIGEAGVGKSRLIYEFTHSHRLQGWRVLESASVSYGKATSYLPVINLLKSYFKIQDRDDLREIREKVTGKLLTLAEALKPTLPALLALLDVPVDDVAWQTLDPGQRRQRTLDAVRGLLLREAREQPLLLIFEDLHWIDGETQAVLDSLIDSLGSARLLLLVNYRPEYQHAWGSKTAYSQMRLDALPAQSARELLEALLGDDPGLASLKQLLVKRGNPFFLEETVRTLVETKELAGEPGRYRLTQPMQAIRVPPTVQAMLAARIDRLPPEYKHLLQVASVVGRDVPFALLQAIAEVPDEALRRGLDHLQAAEFLYETGLYPDLEYSFKHALTHEVTYGGLLQERRRELHAQIVDVIETLYHEQPVEQSERLAYHALRGERWAQAVIYLRKSGIKALDHSANLLARLYLDQALEALRHLPEAEETLRLAVDLRIDLRRALVPSADYEAVYRHLKDAEAPALTLGDPGRLAWLYAHQGNYFAMTKRPRTAEPLIKHALDAAEILGDQQLRITTRLYLGMVYVGLGHYQQADTVLRDLLQFVTGEAAYGRFGQTGYPAVLADGLLAWSLAQRGEFAEAITRAEKALGLATQMAQPLSLAFAFVYLGTVYTTRGTFRDARVWIDRALAISRERELQLTLSMAAWLSTYVDSMMGREVIAAAQCESIRTTLTSTGAIVPPVGVLLGVGVAHAALVSGGIDDARGLAAAAHARSLENGLRGLEASSLFVLGEVAACLKVPDGPSAASRYKQALTVATELGMRPLVAHCHLGLSRLYRRTGQRDQAQEHLTTATTMYREMDMRFWLEKAEAEMRELA